MAIKTVYVLPGDMIEVRVCTPEFEMGANVQAWRESSRPQKLLVTVMDACRLMVAPMGVSVFAGVNPETARQMLVPKPEIGPPDD